MAAETREPATSIPESKSHDASEQTSFELSEKAWFVGFAGSRFAVFDTSEHTVVFDTTAERGFFVYGHPLTKPVMALDELGLAGFSTAGTQLVASADGMTLLVETDAGLHAVDLGKRGHLLAGWRGEADRDGVTPAVEIAADGSMFAVWSDDRIHLVRTRDGARASWPYRDGDHHIELTPETAHWTDADGFHAVKRESLTGLHVAMDRPHAVASKDGQTFAVWREPENHAPARVEVWRASETKPRARLVSPSVSTMIVADDGRHLAWAEWEGTAGASTFLHTVDVESGVHARFAAKGPLCEIGPERVLGFENGTLKTDAECNPGCPSISREPELVTYDLATGAKVGTSKGELVAPFVDAIAEHEATAERLAKRFGLERDEEGTLPLVVPSRGSSSSGSSSVPSSIVVVSNELLVVTAGGELRLPSSTSFTADGVNVTPDGTRVVAANDHRLAVWNAETGRLLWSSALP